MYYYLIFSTNFDTFFYAESYIYIPKFSKHFLTQFV